MHFTLSRALVAAFAMWLGWQIAPAHPFWIAMTLLIVVVPDRQQAARTSWQRAIGTLVGVAIAAGVLSIDLPQITLLLLWLLVTLMMMAVQDVNYLLYASILTLNLLLFYQLLEADVLFNGMERLVTTLLGIAFAMGIIVLLEYLAKKQPSGDPVGLPVGKPRSREIRGEYDLRRLDLWLRGLLKSEVLQGHLSDITFQEIALSLSAQQFRWSRHR